jgi:hypothetical protein
MNGFVVVDLHVKIISRSDERLFNLAAKGGGGDGEPSH